MPRLISIWLICCLAACETFPEVDAAFAATDSPTPPPQLASFDTLLSAEAPRLTETSDADLIARAQALRQRADSLKGPVIDRPTKVRMAAGVTLP